jgi:hypothetical protein
MRALKRRLSDVVYRALLANATHPPYITGNINCHWSKRTRTRVLIDSTRRGCARLYKRCTYNATRALARMMELERGPLHAGLVTASASAAHATIESPDGSRLASSTASTRVLARFLQFREHTACPTPALTRHQGHQGKGPRVKRSRSAMRTG